jgi:WD40 repeat protein
MMALTLMAVIPFLAAAQPLPEGAIVQWKTDDASGPMGFDAILTPDDCTLVVRQGARGSNYDPPYHVLLYDAITGLERKRLDVVAAEIAIARNVPMLAVATASGVEVWDLTKQQRVHQWPYPNGARSVKRAAVAIAPDGTQVAVAAGEESATIWRWDTATGARLASLDPQPKAKPAGGPRPMLFGGGKITALRYDPDGRRLYSARYPTTDERGAVAAWDAKTGLKLVEHAVHGYHVALSAGGGRYADSDMLRRSITVGVLDPKDQAKTEIAVNHDGAELSADGKELLIFTHEQPVRVWDVAMKKETRRFDGAVFISPGDAPPRMSQSGKYLIGHEYYRYRDRVPHPRTIRWDMATGKRIRFTETFSNAIDGLAYAPDGKRLACFSSGVVRIFNPQDGAVVHKWRAHDDTIEQIAYSADGKLLATGSRDGTIALWNADNAKERRRLQAKAPVQAIAFARDGTTLTAACADYSLQSWDVEKGTLRERKEWRKGSALPVLAPNAAYLATREFVPWKVGHVKKGSPIYLMNTATGKEEPPLDLGEAVPLALTFSTDGAMLAASTCVVHEWGYGPHTSQHAVRIWDTATRKEILQLKDNPARIRLLAVSQDKRILVHGIGQYFSSGGATENRLYFRDLSQRKSESLDASIKGEKGIEDWIAKNRFPLIATGNYVAPYCLTFSPDGKRLATGGWFGVTIWDVAHFHKAP